ncbi:hypothetical protein Taro_013238 [Colocasia esculenta]|uniref:Uncharacterized protein n=1 Tax=Colocasia esculenta TaxID=4460 RepID=A0A843UFV0_COLES|nr:hypothetical protein [Colocasia esculenta]
MGTYLVERIEAPSGTKLKASLRAVGFGFWILIGLANLDESFLLLSPWVGRCHQDIDDQSIPM